MSVNREKIIAALSKNLPKDIVEHLIDEYNDIKRHFYLRQYRPNELNGGRFGECIIRMLQYLHTTNYTPFGQHIQNTNQAINAVSQNTSYTDTIRFLIPNLTRVLLDVRNKRNVAHVGGEVDPNFSDALFVCHSADWILTEIVRHFYSCSIDEARKIAQSINEVRIPIVSEIDGFVRVQNTSLDAREKTLVVLYYKQSSKVNDEDLSKWVIYQNLSRYRNNILVKLHLDALIHYDENKCLLLPKGVSYVEKNIPLDLLV